MDETKQDMIIGNIENIIKLNSDIFHDEIIAIKKILEEIKAIKIKTNDENNDK